MRRRRDPCHDEGDDDPTLCRALDRVADEEPYPEVEHYYPQWGALVERAIAEQAAVVVLWDVDESVLNTTLAELADGPTQICGYVVDVSDSSSVVDTAAAVLREVGPIDVLINNVGIGSGDTGATKLTEESWDLIHDVNLKGMWLTCKHIVPLLRAQGSGAVVNVSSVAAVCSVGFLAYKTSKAGVNALTHQLAMSSVKRGVRVNAIMPGLMDTPMAIEGISEAAGVDPDDLRRLRDSMVPLGGKMGTAWDVAEAVLYLASDRSRFVTGVILPVDGGQSARIG